jgi:polysaccharide export outer membrane protein
VDCNFGDGCGETRWSQWGRIPWQQLGQGEYIGPARNPDVPVYLARVDDLIEFRYVATRYQSGKQYRIQAGDELKIESLVDPNINRSVVVQPDGTITLLLLDQVTAVRLTIAELTALLKEKYKEYYKIFDLTVSPVKTNTRLDDLLAAVNNRFNAGGQGQQVRVAADGTISLTKIGKVPAQGLSLDELGAEVNARYAEYVEGLETTPILIQRAPHFCYVLGDVKNGSRFQMDRPTTVMQAIAMANGINNGGNLRQVVVFRRAEDWRLIATKLDIRGAVYGYRPTPADEIFLRDSDIVLVPKSSIKRTDDFLELIMTNGFYRIFPVQVGQTTPF